MTDFDHMGENDKTCPIDLCNEFYKNYYDSSGNPIICESDPSSGNSDLLSIHDYNDNIYRRVNQDNCEMIKLINLTDSNSHVIIKRILLYLESTEFNNIIKNYSELLTIKDEMLIIINKTNYLFSLK
jgi:hypothetical protein